MGERYTEGGAWDPKAAPASPPKPEGQEWPFTDPKAMESIERGIADAKAGRIYGTGEAGGPHPITIAYDRWMASTTKGIDEIEDSFEALQKAVNEAAPAPQGLREAAAIRDFVARTEARARSMSGTAPGWVFLREAMKAEMSLLGAASASVSPKGEPSNPSISSNGSPSSPVIPDNSLNEGNSASTGSL